ncbi:MAG TPA: c-type cytochrome [Pirellulaceae bacterium]|nr:c-type cytochrome [Pirellulaceae bacterium]
MRSLRLFLFAAAAVAAGPALSLTTLRAQDAQLPEIQPIVGSAPAEAVTPTDWKAGPPAKWIWGASNDKNYILRKTFSIPATAKVKSARLIASVDNVGRVMVNRQNVGSSSEWQQPMQGAPPVQVGENMIQIVAENQGGAAAAALKLKIELESGEPIWIVTDESWLAASREAEGTKPVPSETRVVGTLGDQPWGDVFSKPSGPVADTKAFRVPDGFQVEKLYVVPKATQGSWVSIAFDPQGRLLASAQDKEGIYRVTPSPIGPSSNGVGQPTKVEKLPLEITSAQGLLCAFGKLYLSVNGGPGSGLYVAEDTNSDGEWDTVRKLKDFQGGGEHGPHALRLSPDGKSIFVIAGNHTKPPEGFDASRIPSNWGEDLLLPRQWDARGHAAGILAPGGWIAKTDSEGKTWELLSIGYRNAYDFDLGPEGELFAYDADMEWDYGTPWYRPTRVVHATSGSEFGWRSGAGKWPVWYEDSLPPVVDIGPGSPVGVTFGYGAKFPAKWQQALYCADWTFGTLYAIHLKPEGSTWTGEKEEFVARGGLPLTDVAVGPDGAMYFTVGGRGTQSELYRVTYVGKEPVGDVKSFADVPVSDPEAAKLREMRQSIEVLHQDDVRAEDAQIDLAIKNLGSPHRFLRYAARIGLEQQKNAGIALLRLVLESGDARKNHPQTVISAAIGLSRQGKSEDLSLIADSLLSLPLAELSVDQQLGALRAYQLAFIRQGRPDAGQTKQILAQLEPLYPNADPRMNRELAIVLVYLDSPVVIERTLALFEKPTERSQEEVTELLSRNPGYGSAVAATIKNAPEAEKMALAYTLRNAKFGWTLEQRRAYFEWLKSAETKSGGNSYEGFIANIRKDAMETLSEAEKLALEDATKAPVYRTEELPKPIGPGKKRDVAAIVATWQSLKGPRDFEAGKRAFAASQCVACHRFAGDGGATGPDLSNVAGRFPIGDLAEAIVLPSKVISDQYQAHQVLTSDGRNVTGRLLLDTPEKITVGVDPVDPNKTVEVKRADIELLQPSKVSLMPDGTIDGLNDEELRDLLAYLYSRGNPDDPVFAK